MNFEATLTNLSSSKIKSKIIHNDFTVSKKENQADEHGEVLLTCQPVQRASVLTVGQSHKHHLLPEMSDPREGQHQIPPPQELSHCRFSLTQHRRRSEENIHTGNTNMKALLILSHPPVHVT